ncbi:MAG: dTMP kinase [Armatimonadota bacterium]
MFITFEGPEGSGKTTQIALLAETLREKGREVVVTREPGGVPAAEAIRELVLHGRVWPETEALLFLAARAEHMREVVLPALERGAVVVCDRFNDSTLAYQGYGLGLPVDRLRELCDFACTGRWPDLTLLLDLPPAAGLRRRFGGGVFEQLHLEIDLGEPAGRAEQGAGQAINKMENRALDFHERVRQGFLTEAERAPGRIYRIEAARTVKQVRQEIWRVVKSRLTAVAAETVPGAREETR